MTLFSSRKFSSSVFLLILTCSGLIAGCGADLSPAATDDQAGSAIKGVAYGGQFPISGAHIYLMAANIHTLKGPSLSVLSKGDGTDSVGTYVLTQSDGSFSISNDYTCSSGAQIYALAMGGNPGQVAGTYNTAATMVAVLGACPTGQTFAGVLSFIVINEVSTVAAAYSLAAFASDYKDIGGPNTAGLKNAFLSAANLVNLSSGQAYVKTPGVNGYPGGQSSNGTVPQAKIYSLANSLGACVNSTGSTGASTGCGNLFAATTYNNVVPTDVFDACLALAHNPGVITTTPMSPNAGVFAVAAKSPPFGPTLSASPTDWTISIKYSAPNTSYPSRPAADLQGDIWIPNVGNSSITELGPTGLVLSGNGGFTGGGMAGPTALAIDTTTASGPVWVANYDNGVVAKFNQSGAPVSTSGYSTTNGSSYFVAMQGSNPVIAGNDAVTTLTGGGSGSEVDKADEVDVGATVDASNNVWAAQYTNPGTISKLASGNTTSTKYSGGGLNNPTSLAADSAGNIWVVNAGSSVLSEFGSNGTPVSAAGYSGGGLLKAYAVRIDSAGYVYTGNTNGSISVFGSGTGSSGTAGSPVSGTIGYTTASTASYNANPGSTFLGIAPSYGIVGLAIDLSGNVWAPDLDGSIYEFVGLAAPVAP